MSWRTTLAGVLAALAVLAALSEIPPWARAIAGVLHALALAFLGAVSRDHAAPVLLPCDPVERVRLPIAKDTPSRPEADVPPTVGP